MQGTSQDDDHSHDDGCLLNVYVPGTDQNALCKLSCLLLEDQDHYIIIPICQMRKLRPIEFVTTYPWLT